MNTLEITLQRKVADRWLVVAERSAVGSELPLRSEGELSIDEGELLSALADAKGYGQLLGQGLFKGGIRDAFARAHAESDGTLRVLLCVEDEGLRALRWERLCAPIDDQWSFLALNQRAPLSLYLPSQTDRRFPPIGRRDLKALVLIANPAGLEKYGLPTFDDRATARSIVAALGEIPCDVLGEGEGAVGPPTLDALCERITTGGYSLLHLVCHGRFHPDSGETLLYLARAGGGVDPVKAATLIDRLGNLQGARGLPHFAFLCTCESAIAQAEGALGGLGQRLVRELGMPAVVAMTEKISVVTAEALSAAFYRQLRAHGEVDRALVEASAGLQGRPDATVPALFSRLGGKPLFSDRLDRELTGAEIKFGLARCEVLMRERAPVLIPRFDELAQVLRNYVAAPASAASASGRDERNKILNELEQLCEEVTEIRFAALAQDQAPAPYDGRCPFPGLYAFKPDDREFFCGRERLIDRLAERLSEHPLLALLGPSGSGKTSLVLAGLLPRLQVERPGRASGYLTPTADPVRQLEAALAQLPATGAIIVVDQFEELFTLCADARQRQQFIARLLALPGDVQVVITMRADFWGECATHAELKQAMLSHQELIGPMEGVELRRSLEQQAAKVRLRFEADLGNAILDDVQGEPGAMPLLQHALLELWKRRHGRWLRTEEYRAIGAEQGNAGGVRGAIARSADDVFKQLARADQDIMREVFARLTNLGDETGPGAQRRDTRRRAQFSELVPAGQDEQATQRIVTLLADARLLVTSRNALSGDAEVEVAHEALIRYWPRLQRWLDEDRVVLRLREAVSDAASEWRKRPTDQDLLIHKGGRLEEVEKLQAQGRLRLNELEQDYISACQKLRRAQDRRRKTVIISLAILAGAAMLGAVGAKWQANRAQTTIATARGFTDHLMFTFLDQLDDIENTQLVRKELVRKIGELHARLGQVETHEDQSTLFWQRVLEGDLDLEANPKKLARAEEKFQAAMKVAQPLAAADAGWQRNLSIGYGKLADVALARYEQGEDTLPQLRDLLSKALDLDKQLVANAPHNLHWRRDLSLSYARMGNVEVMEKNQEAARKCYQESHQIAADLAEQVRDVEARRDLAYSHIRLGDWAYIFDKLEQARDAYAVATQIGDSLPAGQEHWQRELMSAHGRLGELTLLLDDQRIAHARQSSRRALELAKALADKDPNDWRARMAAFANRIQLGNVEKAGQDFKAARDVLSQAMEEGRELLRRPDMPPYEQEQVRKAVAQVAQSLARIPQRQ